MQALRHRRIPLALELIGVLLCAVAAPGCQPDSARETEPAGTLPRTTRDRAAGGDPDSAGTETAASVYDVACGCHIESIGYCGNYVYVDGEPLAISGDVGLGDMEFCGQSGLRASIEGERFGDTFVASSFELRD